MKLYPAIDLKDGKCVRLIQGDFKQVTVFSDNPVSIAKQWESQGASFLHIVDLDGARIGSGFNQEVIAKIVKNINIPIQVGGGIRTFRDIEQKLSCGVARVILGTAAIADPCFVKEAIRKYGEQIVIGIDAKDGNVAISGWEEISNKTAIDLCLQMEQIGAKTIVYTDISKDGAMSGPNIEATKHIINAVSCDIIASGGVSCMQDLEEINQINASGAIIGKSLYLGAINLKQAIEMFEK